MCPTGWTDLKSVTGNTTANAWLDYTGLAGTGRYVRMRGTARATGWGYSLYEFEIYGAAAGTATKLSGAAGVTWSASTTGSWNNQGNTYVKVFDGDLATAWDSPNADGNWVQVDLGAQKTITQIKYAARSGFSDRMNNGMFRASNTADFSSGVVTLYTVGASEFPPNSLTSRDVSSVAGTYRYVRYYSPTNGWGNIAEMEVWGASAAPAGTTGLTPTGWSASASNNTGQAGNLIDASGNSTRWASNTNMSSGMWVQLDLGSAQTFNRLVMDSGSSTNDYARGYQILVSDNGTDWAIQTAIASGTGSSAVIDVSFTSVTKRYVRIVQTGSDPYYWWTISDLKLYV